MLFIFYYSQWQLTVPFRKARYCITQLENWSYLRLKNQQCSDLNSQAKKKEEKEKKERGEVLTDLRATQQIATCQAQKQLEVPKSLCEHKLWFLSSSIAMLERRIQIQLNAWWSPSKLLLQAKCNILALLTHQKRTVCVCVSSQLFAANTHRQEPGTYREILISSTCTEHLFSWMFFLEMSTDIFFY